MKPQKTRILLIALACLGLGAAASRYVAAQAGPALAAAPAGKPTRLALLWTTADPEVAHKMAFMYLHNSQKNRWFDENVLIVWGPSARLLSNDKDLQARVQAMMKDGIRVQACVACADMYGVAGRLRELGIEVKGMGKPLTEYLQGDWRVLSL